MSNDSESKQTNTGAELEGSRKSDQDFAYQKRNKKFNSKPPKVTCSVRNQIEALTFLSMLRSRDSILTFNMRRKSPLKSKSRRSRSLQRRTTLIYQAAYQKRVSQLTTHRATTRPSLSSRTIQRNTMEMKERARDRRTRGTQSISTPISLISIRKTLFLLAIPI
jgi:hypothetical protein